MKQLSKSSQSLIPNLESLADFLKIESCPPQYQLIASQMLNPLEEMLSSSGKKIRFEMTEIAFRARGGTLTERTRRQLEVCEQIIEGLHLGSMIIDDIQDQSEVRRGRPTFHRKYGVGTALNAGNWLYFQAIQQVQHLGLESNQELLLQRRLNEILLKAHFGQGIDVSVNLYTLPQSQVESTYFTVAELKTGALMTLAFTLGSAVAGLLEAQEQPLSKLAKQFGIALQIFDDIGNYLAPPPKGKEDLKLGRPSFLWVMAAKTAIPSDYERFKMATRMLPDTSFIDSWSALFDLVPRSKAYASHYLFNLKTAFLEACAAPLPAGPPMRNDGVLKELRDQVESLFIKLENAYG